MTHCQSQENETLRRLSPVERLRAESQFPLPPFYTGEGVIDGVESQAVNDLFPFFHHVEYQVLGIDLSCGFKKLVPHASLHAAQRVQSLAPYRLGFLVSAQMLVYPTSASYGSGSQYLFISRYS